MMIVKHDPCSYFFFPFFLLLLLSYIYFSAQKKKYQDDESLWFNILALCAPHTRKNIQFSYNLYERNLKYMRQQRCALLYRSKQTNNIFFTFATYPT